jgi:hypothetical protein
VESPDARGKLLAFGGALVMVYVAEPSAMDRVAQDLAPRLREDLGHPRRERGRGGLAAVGYRVEKRALVAGERVAPVS